MPADVLLSREEVRDAVRDRQRLGHQRPDSLDLAIRLMIAEPLVASRKVPLEIVAALD